MKRFARFSLVVAIMLVALFAASQPSFATGGRVAVVRGFGFGRAVVARTVIAPRVVVQRVVPARVLVAPRVFVEPRVRVLDVHPFGFSRANVLIVR